MLLRKSKFWLVLLVITLLVIVFINKNYLNRSPSKPYDKNINQASKDIFTDDFALYSYVRKFGPKQTISRLDELSQEFGSCHDAAHQAGRFSYEIYKEKAFKECGAQCHSGCYHGATEAYFKEKGTTNLQNNLQTLCSLELNPFFSHQCLHGIGHGLMAWANYELDEALKGCDLLNTNKESCYTGVFMENIVGGLTDKESEHFTKYLSDDPLYPCNEVAEKYKSSCYFLQTSRMVQLFKGDFAKVADSCLKVPGLYQRACFESMGRDVGGAFRGKVNLQIIQCNFAPAGDLRVGCLIGAAQDNFWDSSGSTAAIDFCRSLSIAAEKDACYNTIFARAPLVLQKAELVNFCARIEDNYLSRCQQTIN